MEWYSLNKKYIDYLKLFDNRVPNVDYSGRMKCFLGIVILSKDEINYFIPLTSYKPKFLNMNNNIDFYKIQDQNGKIYGALDLNNMIPVPEKEYKKVTETNLDEFREFENKRDKKNYWKLLQKELSCIDKNVILYNAEKLYRFVCLNTEANLSERCCNFSLLEEKCKEWNDYMFLKTYNQEAESEDEAEDEDEL